MQRIGFEVTRSVHQVHSRSSTGGRPAGGDREGSKGGGTSEAAFKTPQERVVKFALLLCLHKERVLLQHRNIYTF